MSIEMYKTANRRLAANKIRLEIAGIPVEIVSLRFIEYTNLPLVPYYLSHKHRHSYYEVGLWLQGKQNYVIEDKTVEVKGGDIFFTAPNVYHAIPNCEPYIEKYTICFSIGSAKDGKEAKWASNLREIPYYIGVDNQELREIFELILTEAYNAGEGWQESVKCLIAVLILKMARLLNPEDIISEELEGISELDQRMLTAERFIRDNLATVTTPIFLL